MENTPKLKRRNPAYKNIFSRAIPFETLKKEERTVTGILSTEDAVVVADWFNWRIVREVLLVDGMEVPDKMPLLNVHSRFDLSDIKGSVINPRKEKVEDRGLVWIADYVISSTAEREWTLIEEGHLDSTSIGYEVFPDQSIELKPGESREINGRLFKNDYPDKLPLIIRLKSKVFETSLVPIGANQYAKFRDIYGGEGVDEEGINDGEVKKSIEELREEINNLKKLKVTLKGDGKMDETKNVEQRVNAIDALAEKFKDKIPGVDLKEQAELFKLGGKSEREFADFIFERQKANASFGKPTVPLAEKEVQKYDIMNGIRALYKGQRSFETEVSEEYMKQTGHKAEGLFVPINILWNTGKRDLQATGTNAGAELVGTDHLGAEFIDYLYSAMVLDNITLLPNRKGNVEIPVLSASAGFGWAATENAAFTEGSPTTALKTASPKRGGRYIEISKQLLLQSDPPAEMLFKDDLLKSIALGIQNAVLNGSGSSGEPTGVKNTSGIGSVGDLTSFTWSNIVNFESLIDDNFGDDKQMYFVTRRAHRGKLKATPKATGYPVYMCDDNNRMNGYEVRTTNLVSSGDVFFGDWSQVIVPMWDAVDIVVNPYSLDTQGLVRITAQQLLDVIVRYPQAFSYGNNFPV